MLEPAELLPVGPVADQVGVGDQHPRRPLVGAHDADRLAALHEQRLVVVQRGQGADDRVVRLPVAGGLAGAAVDDEVSGCSATSGSRLFISIRSGASVCQVCAVSSGAARRARTSRGAWLMPVLQSCPRRRRTRAPLRTRSTAASISGARCRSGPGPSTWRAAARRPPRVAGDGSSGAAQVERAGRGEDLDRDHPGQPVDRAAQLAGRRPAHRHVVLLHRARRDRVDAGRAASRLSSETIAAWVYCAIMWPESTPGSSARNGGSPWLRALSRNRSVRRSLIEATSAATIARKSST